MTKIKLRFAAATALATFALFPAQANVPPIKPVQSDPVQNALANDEIAWNIIEGLTTEIGPRQAGTDAEARARTWAVTKLKPGNNLYLSFPK